MAQALTPTKKKTPAKAGSKGAVSRIAVRHVALGVTTTPPAPNAAAPKTPAKTSAKAPARKVISSGPWRSPNYADSPAGDVATAEDPIARQAAIDGLGKLNGAVVVSDAKTGRILAMVNQKLALQAGSSHVPLLKSRWRWRR